jgi:hypothetical protein
VLGLLVGCTVERAVRPMCFVFDRELRSIQLLLMAPLPLGICVEVASAPHNGMPVRGRYSTAKS